jgi:hypothetical protein
MMCDYTLRKLDVSGAELVSVSLYDEADCLGWFPTFAVDGDDNLAVTHYDQLGANPLQALVIKTDPDGVELLRYAHEMPSNRDRVWWSALAFEPGGSIVTVGRHEISDSVHSALIRRHAP